jgi:hypothetical protein
VAHFADQVKLAFIVADDSLGKIIEVIGALPKRSEERIVG